MNAILQKKMEPNIKSHSTINLPQDRNILSNAMEVVTNGLNKANKSKQVDLKTALVLRDAMRIFNSIITNVIKTFYDKDGNLLNVPVVKNSTPDEKRLKCILIVVIDTINKAQINGAYDTIEESGNLYDGLSVISNLLNSITEYDNIQKSETEIDEPTHDFVNKSS